MARGWESKAVEEQMEAAQQHPAENKPELDAEQVQREQERAGLELSRARVRAQLAASQNPRLTEMLERALAELEGRLAELEK